jgi:acetyl/propionyl-CoA carboxylase alpha subunit
VIRRAGAKDEAKKLARGLGNTVIPGVDDVSARILARRAPDRAALEKLAREHGLEARFDPALSHEENAEVLLQAGYANRVELVTIEELQARAEEECRAIWSEYPSNRIRFKHVAGGGGKGQRVVTKPEEVAAAVMDVLAEVKVLAAGSNRNFLIELNIESTRHNEIQLVGNGDWCVSLGGRDCSVQMHEQKLLEVSLTQELLDVEVAQAQGGTAEVLRGDKGTLERMETEGARFGEATGLDSVSTFECIVEGFNHFFMEMNTRIQVEHVVTELVYRIRFVNPDDPGECFHVDRLIEVMLLLALHGPRLPKPERHPRSVSGLEVRVNATNQALQPHAGGLIRGWSPPIEGETRYDQGIGARNPDTGSFVYYALAGAYDSNVALLCTDGDDRRHNLERMAEILRKNELRGEDLETNVPVHYGLVNWFLGHGPMAAPDTRFMIAFLAGVGSLQQLLDDVDLDLALAELSRRQEDGEARTVLARKETLLLRPIEKLFANPHLLAGFLGRFEGVYWTRSQDDVGFAANPVGLLDALYHYLHMEEEPGKPPSEKIWDHDGAILRSAQDFYASVSRATGLEDWAALQELFAGARDDRLAAGDDARWQACVAAHRGFQLGLELLLVIPRIGIRSGFCDIAVNEELEVVFPDAFVNSDAQALLTRSLAPPPPAGSDEIVTPMGGTFYGREAPHLPVMVEVGDHIEAGRPLFIIEVMKMFNKVVAPFSGTITENLMSGQDGVVVAKGERIFRIDPDERVEEESEQARAARVRERTLALL